LINDDFWATGSPSAGALPAFCFEAGEGRGSSRRNLKGPWRHGSLARVCDEAPEGKALSLPRGPAGVLSIQRNRARTVASQAAPSIMVVRTAPSPQMPGAKNRNE